jgi:hypothetical protein
MSPNLELEQTRKNWRLFIRFICPLHQTRHSILLKKCKSNKTSTFLPSSKISNPNVKWKYYFSFAFAFQEDFWSTALKTLITVSTIILLGLIVAYHALEVQVSKLTLNLFVCLMVYITSVLEHALEKASEAFLWRNWRVRFQLQQQQHQGTCNGDGLNLIFFRYHSSLKRIPV